MFRCHLFLELVHVASLSPRSTCIIIIISQVYLLVYTIADNCLGKASKTPVKEKVFGS